MENDLQLRRSYESSPPCRQVVYHLVSKPRQIVFHLLSKQRSSYRSRDKLSFTSYRSRDQLSITSYRSRGPLSIEAETNCLSPLIKAEGLLVVYHLLSTSYRISISEYMYDMRHHSVRVRRDSVRCQSVWRTCLIQGEVGFDCHTLLFSSLSSIITRDYRRKR